MKTGIVTWTLGTHAVQPIIAKAKELGLDCIQYAGDHRDVDPTLLRTQAQAAGLTIIAVDPINAGPNKPAAATQQAAIDYYRHVVDFAAALGQVPVTLHGLSLWTRNCPDRAQARERLLQCCRAVDDYAQSLGVPTLYEVCNHYELPLIHTAEECVELLRDIGSRNIRMILDSFHMNINEPDPLRTLREHAAHTAIYHISDSGRGGIGSGHIDFQAHYDQLIAAGFTGDVAVELVLPHLIPSQSPVSQADHNALDREIQRSVARWSGFQSSAA